MNFRMEIEVPAHRDAIWPIFFDVARIAALIPGCEQVEEKVPLVLYSAVMKQKIGPFKMDAATEVSVEARTPPSHVRARARGRDRVTGTTLDVLLDVALAATEGDGTRLVVDSTLVVAGRLATLGYPVVKKKSEQMFVEFERRLRTELGLVHSSTPEAISDAPGAL